MKITETITVEKDVYVAPCFKCGSEDIKFGDCGYWQGNSGGGKCQSCNHEEWHSCGRDPSKERLIEIWNKHNDLDILQAEQTKIIEDAQAKRALLREILIQRNVKFLAEIT